VRPRKDIYVAADFDASRGVAGIAATFRGGRVIACDVVAAGDPLSADLLAVLRQVAITVKPGALPALICTDAAAISHCLRGEVEPATGQADELLEVLACHITRAKGKVQIATVSEEATRSAFIAAKQTRKAWSAGREGRNQTWSVAA
jgi:hypothetical protein